MKNGKVLYLSFELLEMATFLCDMPLHTQIATKDFLIQINYVLNMKDLPEQIKIQVLKLISRWNAYIFKEKQDLFPYFFEFFKSIEKKGFQVPQPTECQYMTLEVKKRLADQNQPSHIQKHKEQSPGLQRSQSSSRKIEQLKKEFEILQGNLDLTNDIIDALDGEDPNKNEVLTDLINTMKNMDKQLQQFIQDGPIQGENMMDSALLLNDYLHSTLERYRQAIQGKITNIKRQKTQEKITKKDNFDDFGIKNETNKQLNFDFQESLTFENKTNEKKVELNLLDDLLDNNVNQSNNSQKVDMNNQFQTQLPVITTNITNLYQQSQNNNQRQSQVQQPQNQYSVFEALTQQQNSNQEYRNNMSNMGLQQGGFPVQSYPNIGYQNQQQNMQSQQSYGGQFQPQYQSSFQGNQFNNSSQPQMGQISVNSNQKNDFSQRDSDYDLSTLGQEQQKKQSKQNKTRSNFNYYRDRHR